MTRKLHFAVLAALGLMFASVSVADAFCGFYVAGSGDQLVNNASQVVMMREGTTTVLSMQNSYKGPPANFAMVVPVPVVLEEDNVKILSDDLFKRVDRLAAPRLVEYWEQDPCMLEDTDMYSESGAGPPRKTGARNPTRPAKDMGVTVEAEFTVGEYEIVILSAKFSTGLEDWLKAEKYSIPQGAEEHLRPYVQSGSKFFVAKVNAEKVKFVDGKARLSPLRFHYESKDFQLPVRLGLMNAEGKQDLIVHILAQGTRYEVANYPNVTIPTNLDLQNTMRDRFGEFYAALFDSTLEKNKNAVVTEYSWSAASCDPCPSPPLSWADLMSLGYDVTGASSVEPPTTIPRRPVRPARGRRISGRPGKFVLTRLHARYDKSALGEDLVFRKADPIVGGRERQGRDGLEKSSSPGRVNNFQARYAIRHEWRGAIDCEKPTRGIWGGPPSGQRNSSPMTATELAFAPRGGITLGQAVIRDIPELGVKASKVTPAKAVETSTKDSNPKANNVENSPNDKPDKKGCNSSGGSSTIMGMLLMAWLALTFRRRSQG